MTGANFERLPGDESQSVDRNKQRCLSAKSATIMSIVAYVIALLLKAADESYLMMAGKSILSMFAINLGLYLALPLLPLVLLLVGIAKNKPCLRIPYLIQAVILFCNCVDGFQFCVSLSYDDINRPQLVDGRSSSFYTISEDIQGLAAHGLVVITAATTFCLVLKWRFNESKTGTPIESSSSSLTTNVWQYSRL
ncbi:hypothetical protein M3Y99_00340700 [Aphelenchoides fujianensis]|nr:hypothetical protein M3Y99_00340700 [Aphelenchoides fujianensis]